MGAKICSQIVKNMKIYVINERKHVKMTNN